jgi:lipopolysaccharide/colanic/teichoic acid biosynthesis glycosyltransferase
MPLTPWFGSNAEKQTGNWLPPGRRSTRWTPAGHSPNGSAESFPGPAAGRVRQDSLRLVLVQESELPDENSFRYAVRRSLNILVALFGILITLPVMAAVALLVKLTSPGPVLFTQPRVGLDRRWRTGASSSDPRRKKDLGGRIFQIYKFRTMTHCSHGDREQKWATPDDPRVTRVGRILRKYRLDELPQFFNVLKGDMNIVGPRPEQPEIFQELRNQVDGYQRRQRVLPGITGLSQVNHHYDRSIKDVEIKVRYDLEYVKTVSTVEDLRIMAQTLPVVLFRKGGW